jgi:hypothetical protein
VAALTRPLVLAIVLLGLLAVAAPALLRNAPDIGDRIRATASDPGAKQSGSQISVAEFELIREGSTPGQLRALVGEPASRDSTKVEGVALECWYYGVGGATGAYQFCFADGWLSTKLRFDRSGL